MNVKQIFVRHFLVSFGLMLVSAILSGFFQYQSAFGELWFVVFAVLSILGLVFSILFAIFQSKLQHSILNTAFLLGMLFVYFVVLYYVDLHLKIDWNAISEGRVHLTLFEKFVKSDWSFWLAFIVPFILSILIDHFKSKPR